MPNSGWRAYIAHISLSSSLRLSGLAGGGNDVASAESGEKSWPSVIGEIGRA